MNVTERANVERDESWRELSNKIPFIKFKEHWEVRVMPPWCFALARFNVRDSNKKDSPYCSIYLDILTSMQGMDGCFWEVCTLDVAEPERFELLDVEGVVDCIDRQLKLANMPLVAFLEDL